MSDYCEKCEEPFAHTKPHEHERFYDSEVCYKCAEEEWERYNDRQSEYWA